MILEPLKVLFENQKRWKKQKNPGFSKPIF